MFLISNFYVYFHRTNDQISHILDYGPIVHLGSIAKNNVLADRVTVRNKEH